jgi:M3 family oligoendopeptidase
MKFSKFQDVDYPQPDMEKVKKDLTSLTSALHEAKTGTEAIKIIYKEMAYEDKFITAYKVASIKHSIDINNEKYKALTKFYDFNVPFVEQYANDFAREFVSSPFRRELEKEFGSVIFDKLELSMKTTSAEAVPLLQEENALVSSYGDVMGNAKGIYRGQEIPITKFDALRSSPDREIRRDASKGYWDFFATHEKELGDIYDKLVHKRAEIAKTLGFASFTDLAYARLGRLDYGPEDVKKYREEVLKEIVPVAEKLWARQASRIGISDMKYYDWTLKFKSGNPTPKGTPEDLVKDAQEMYKEMDPVASKYFNFMVSHGVMDLEAKAGKVPGGYMEYLPDLKSSFIFSNFNGSSGDVDVLTHEFGHSLQGFLTSDVKVPALRSPGYEACEIHSMSMEFFAYPWMKLFFGADEEKYRFDHLVDGITFIPYGVSVDEFQHFVYANPDCGQEGRMKAWREIEKKYMPHKQYGAESPFLERGGWWMRQLHIFEYPFYYIDYTIAQVGAFEFFVKSLADFKGAFAQYLAYDRLGGSLPFKKLMAAAGLDNPMTPTTIPEIVPQLIKYLDSINDRKY